jgi:hypothetical protein
VGTPVKSLHFGEKLKTMAVMLEATDDLELFDRSNGVDPCLLLDGHGSRFELPFVEYIHGELKRKVMIGVPYGMSLW